MLLALLLATFAWVDNSADRTAIERITLGLTGGQKPLFTADADSQLDRLRDLDRSMVESSKKPWSEVLMPRMVVQSIRFIAPDVAAVDAVDTQFGSTISRRIPVLLIMRKEAGEWRIASLRVIFPSAINDAGTPH